MLHINDITFRIADRLLFDSATVTIPAGHKVGFVGRNGTGKSTLFKMILKQLTPEGGTISVRPRASIGHVGQEAPDGPQSLLQTVLDSNHEMTALTAEAEIATDPHRIAEIHTRLADIDAHTADARAARILAGLGFDSEAQARPCASFSGGWRMRVALACVLFNTPDLLLLDEPTNYLDLEGVMWLESFLKTYPYTVFLVSHDRDLLNKAVTHIVHLEEAKLNLYTGGYDRFEELRRLKMENQLAMKSKQEAERRHIQSFVDRFRAQANKAKQAQSRIKALQRMKPIATMVQEHTIPFRFPKPEPLSDPLITVEDVSVGYEENKPILKKLELRIDSDDRIALLGANGNGKSTFAKLLSENLLPMEGKMRKPRKLGIGYFAQHQLDELKPKDSPLDHLLKLMPDVVLSKVRARLGSFGFGVDKADRPVESLSGGEKARLMFALATFKKPQMLILDEPTNHLDVDSREALIHAINGYDGAVLLISHDRHLVSACVDRLWIVEDSDVKPFDGDLEDYKQHLLALRAGERASKRKGGKQDNKKEARKAAAEARKALAPLKRAVEKAEKTLESLIQEEKRLKTLMNDPTIYEPGNEDKVADLSILSADVDTQIQDAEDAWAQAEEKYIAAKDAQNADA